MTVVDIAKELIKFDTSGPPTKEQPCAEWIRDFLTDIGIETELQVVEKDRANVIAKIGTGTKPGLILSGHIDTVPPGDPELWEKTSPFTPVVVDKKLYGRGACDMKGPDATILQAVKELHKNKFKRQLNLVFTAGEDTTGWFVKKVLEEKKITPADARYGIVAEPSLLKVIPSHKGSGTTQIRITGKAAHSSTPELGVNAIYMAEKFIRETRILQTELNKKQDPLLGPTTIQCTKINGGFKSNIIPDQVILNYSNRLIPRHKDPKTSRLWFENIIEGLSANDENFHAEIIRHSAKQPLEVSMKEKIVEILVDIVNADPEGAPYYTEAVDYTKAGIPTVICGPGSIDQAHTPDEYISLQQLNDGVRVFKEAIKRVCL